MSRRQPWSLRHRHAEGGVWSVVAGAPRADLGDELLAPSFACAPGDLVALHGPAGTLRGLWVETGGGLAPAPPIPTGRRGPPRRPSWHWLGFWERVYAFGETLLRHAGPVDRRRLVLAACDCAATAVDRAAAADPSRAARQRAALDEARAWAWGPDAERAAPPPWARPDPDLGIAAGARAVAVAPDPAEAAAGVAWEATEYACLSSTGTYVRARRLLAPLVRRHLPLSVVLLARLGVAAPPDRSGMLVAEATP